MRCGIFIHASGEIVKKYTLEFEDLLELNGYYEEAKKCYGKIPGFAFDVMIFADEEDK